MTDIKIDDLCLTKEEVQYISAAVHFTIDEFGGTAPEILEPIQQKLQQKLRQLSNQTGGEA